MFKHSIIDGHCDTLTKLMDQHISLESRTSNHIDIQSLRSGNVALQFFAAWIGSRKKYGPSLQRCLFLLDTFYTILDTHSNDFVQIFSYDDILKAFESNKIGALLTIEGGEALEGQIENLRLFYRLGVRLITLTWNNRNEIADGIMEGNSKSGLSEFGLNVVREMNRLGMIIDVSHISEKGFYDVLNVSSKPVIASHSNARACCSHIRNLTDNQIISISKKGGLIGINFYNAFLSDGNANISDIIKHIEYISALAGIDYIGFGSDFDGMDQLPVDIKGPEDYNKIIEGLLRLNYTEEQIKKITHRNYLRVIKEIL